MKEYSGRLISILYRKSQVYWNQKLKPYNITSAEYPILIILNRQDGITQEEISSYLEIDKSAVTRGIKSLLAKGFIEKKKDEEDMRCNRIYLTEKGHSSKKPIEDGMEEWEAITSKGIEEKEIEQLINILTRMANNVESHMENTKGV